MFPVYNVQLGLPANRKLHVAATV